MYISELKLWNFRKYTNEDGSIDVEHPHLVVPFTKGINVLIGENDSGKTAIIDAIKLVCKTHSIEWIRVAEDDFSAGRDKLRIEVILRDLTEDEASQFPEKITFDGEITLLKLEIEVSKSDDRVLPYEVKANNGIPVPLSAEEKDLIKSTYLKALRDAENELTAKKGSRISQILLGHELFAEGAIGKEYFETTINSANSAIEKWVDDETGGDRSPKKLIKGVIDSFVHSFISNSKESEIIISEANIRNILEKLSVLIKDEINPGLGSMNRLYMATELLNLRKESNCLKLCLIEELEAHLHPQAQMKVVERLQKEEGVQFIMSTHSPQIGSKIKLDAENTTVIICKDSQVYPLSKGMTKLNAQDYKFLDIFLDATKSNLFFAKGVIIVEGWAEELILPALAINQENNLTKSEVSIVNVGSTGYLHYARVLMRNDGKTLDYPVAVVTDYDVKPEEDWSFDPKKESEKLVSIKEKLEADGCDNIGLFVATHWTLEWCLFNSVSLGTMFMDCCAATHNKTQEFKKTEAGYNSDAFRRKLRDKLIDRSLDKVKIATLLSDKILNSEKIDIQEADTAFYLLKAISHVCR